MQECHELRSVAGGRPQFVHLSSQRMLVPVRQDGCFAEKQEPHPALLLIVPSAPEPAPAETPAIKGSSGASACVAFQPLPWLPVAL